MTPVRRLLLATVLAASAALRLPAQPAQEPAAPQSAADQPAHPVETQATVSFQFDRKGLEVPRFTLLVREDGTGTYQAEQVPRASANAVNVAAGSHINRTITVSPATTVKIFKIAHDTDRFNLDCASKAKNIADTGTKTLTYAGPDGRGSCTYNYSEVKSIAALTDIFEAIAFTLDEGRKLDFLHRFDRLGLDAEMTSLSNELEQGRALELINITPSLTSIASDTDVMQRVRLRAAKLLEQAKENK
jgi:hypothetical protein